MWGIESHVWVVEYKNVQHLWWIILSTRLVYIGAALR